MVPARSAFSFLSAARAADRGRRIKNVPIYPPNLLSGSGAPRLKCTEVRLAGSSRLDCGYEVRQPSRPVPGRTKRELEKSASVL
ncbi:hypothetical protein EVAR_6083_1 [Eumeta japonica]|uniref:Uncharacterized protein n=1 Tax=Eumeta variegata TaxID=151549 RepID=A0A4C1TE23_EUMVA|nr:hypothetical protein EVAR_6083_1 [Eumeta japonica]